MIIDLKEAAEDLTLDTDICVIGGGAAGLAIAWHFRQIAGREVTVLEAGGLEFDADTQDLYTGELSGQRYFDLDVTRLRMLGGSTNHWGNQVSPFEAIDFEARPWIPYSGWPISRSDLDVWYDKAVEYLQLGENDFADYANWARDEPGFGPVETPGGVILSKPFRRREPTLTVGHAYVDIFETYPNLRLVLNANVTNMALSSDRTEMVSIEAKSLNGRTVTVRPRQVVLATGGIENPRLLLANNIGNDHDLVGRFFMDHLRVESGYFIPADGVDLWPYDDGRLVSERGRFFAFRLSDEVQRQNEIGVVRLKFSVERGAESRGRDGLNGLKGLLQGRDLDRMHEYVADVFLDIDGAAGFVLDRTIGGRKPASLCVNVIEQAPNPDSRITLTDERDALGMQKIKLHWALAGQERHTLRRSQELFSDAFAAAGIGRLQINDAFVDSDWSALQPTQSVHDPSPFEGGHHHTGSTRMASGPDRGVVDGNCKVFGLANFYIAGSSTFPTLGSANPTFTISALALRLADHLGGLA